MRKTIGRTLMAVVTAVPAMGRSRVRNAVLIAAVLLPVALVAPASASVRPSTAMVAEDCYTIAYAPWHSTSTNRVYFSGGAKCTGSTYPSRIDLSTLWYWGSASTQNYHGQVANACTGSQSCWTAAHSYATYAGYHYYCTVVYAGIAVPNKSLQPTKACAWL